MALSSSTVVAIAICAISTSPNASISQVRARKPAGSRFTTFACEMVAIFSPSA
jgi:hypothetical protein